jgi:hypothetical protein
LIFEENILKMKLLNDLRERRGPQPRPRGW